MNKICTDVKQSKKLIELEIDVNTADMYYDVNNYGIQSKPEVAIGEVWSKDVPAWSLSALFDILPDDTNIIKDKSDTENEKYMCTVGVKDDIISTFGNNPVNVCYKMILKLHELKIL